MVVSVKLVKESVIEHELKTRVEALGGLCVKVKAFGTRGFFDRLVTLPDGKTVFVELKRPKGGRLSKHQIWYGEQFVRLGAVVAVVRNSGDIDALLAPYERTAPPAGDAASFT